MTAQSGQTLQRVVCYAIGMPLLALGLTLTAETRLGSSPLTSIPFVVSICLPISFANATLLLFVLFTIAQLLLRQKRPWLILLQIPVSVLFTRIMGAAQQWIDIEDLPAAARLGFLLLAILLTGVGAAMSLRADLVPCAADGFVQGLAIQFGKPLGMMKNIVDISSVASAVLLSWGLLGRLEGVGIGTVLAMLGVGRVIAVFRRITAVEKTPCPRIRQTDGKN